MAYGGWLPENITQQPRSTQQYNPYSKPGLAEQQFGFQTQLQGQTQQGTLAQLLAQYGYQQGLAGQQAGYTTSNIAQQLAGQQELQRLVGTQRTGEATQQQGFTQANLATQLANQLRMGTQGQEFTQANLATQLASQLKLGGAQFGQQTQLSEQQARQQAALYRQIFAQDEEARRNRLRAAEDVFGRQGSSYDQALQGQAGVEGEQIGREWEAMQRDIESEYGRGGASLSSARDRAMEEGRGGMASALRRSRTTAAVEAQKSRQSLLAQFLTIAGGR